MGRMFEVLGGVRAVGPEGPLELQPQVRRLLGVLLADRGLPVPVERIVDRLWGDDAPPTATKIVHISIGRLRAALEPGLTRTADSRVVLTAADGYAIRAGSLDVDAYEDARRRADGLASAHPEAALEAATQARALWRGRPWGAQADDPWLQAHVTALEERHRALEELWGDLALQCEQVGPDTIERLKAAAESEPLRERRWMQLMLALYRSGRQADALREYERARAVLRDEMGIEPGPELRRLELAILQQDAQLLRSTALDDEWQPTSSFVGRDEELARLTRALERDRLVTVVGLGGIGKTRIVEELARRSRRAGAVLRVSLSGLEQPDRLDVHIAAQLGLFVEGSDPLVNVLAAAIGDGTTLLTIDAAEAMTDAVGALVLGLLPSCGRLRIVVTSRVPLGLRVERVFPLTRLTEARPGVPLDGTDLQLMIDRAGYDEPSLDESTLAELRVACAAAGGIPLLVELAARSFELGAPPRVIEPGTGGDDFDVVRAAIAHSLESVDEPAQDLLHSGAVLPGGVSETMAAALGAMDARAAKRTLRQLAWLHLVDASPLQRTLRYRSLDPIRGALLAGLAPERRERSVACATSALQEIVDRVRPDHTQPVVFGALDDVEDEHDNLRFLLSDRMANDPARALELAIAVSDFWAVRGHSIEGRSWVTKTMRAAAPTGRQRWRAEYALVRVTRTFAEVAELRESLEQACAEARAEPDADAEVILGALLIYLAIARGWHGDRAGAGRALNEVEALARSFGTDWTAANIDHVRAFDRALTGDFVGARDLQRSFAARMLELGDPISAAMGRYLAATMGDMAGRDDVLGDITAARELANVTKDVSLLCQLLRLEARVVQRSDSERARAVLADAVEQLEACGGIRAAALARRDLGLLALQSGDVNDAAAQLLQAVSVLVRLDRSAAAPAVAGIARVAAERGNGTLAARIAAVVPAMRRRDTPSSPDDERRASELVAGIDAAIDGASVDDERLLELCREAALSRP